MWVHLLEFLKQMNIVSQRNKVHLGCQMLQPPGQMNIFQKKDLHILKNMANQIIRIVENIETHNEDQTAWAPPNEPPGYLGECSTTTTTKYKPP